METKKNTSPSEVILFSERHRSFRVVPAIPAAYVTAAKVAFTVITSVTGAISHKKVKDSIKDIYHHISVLYAAVNKLAEDQEKMKNDILNLLEELEYRTIADFVFKTGISLKLLSSKGDKSILSAAYLQLSINDSRLRERLNASFEGKYAHRYLTYLDLFITNSVYMIFDISLIEALSDDDKADQIVELQTSLNSYLEFAKFQIGEIHKARYTVVTSPNGLICHSEKDSNKTSCRQEWGYVKDLDDTTYQKVTSILIVSGGAAAIANNQAEQEKAVQQVQAVISQVAYDAGLVDWQEKYGDVVIQES